MIPARPDQQARLISFTGFGASDLPNGIFRRPGEVAFRKGWEELGGNFESGVAAGDYASLARSTQYAHFTPQFIVRAIWVGLIRMGLKKGRILQPGIGTGMFPALMPDALSKASHITGIELDPVTTRIVRLLQPRARIVCGDFARTDLPDHFDLAIGNPPFSDRSAKSIRLYTSRRPFSLEPFVSQSRFKLYCLGFYAFVVDVLGILPKTGDRLRKTFEPAKRNIHHCNRAGLQPGVAVREGFRKGSEIRTLVDEFFAAPPSP